MNEDLVRGQGKLLWLGGAWLALLLSAGCVDERKDQDAATHTIDQALTAQGAKKALLDLDLKQIPPGVLVPGPKDEPIQVLGPDEIAVGIWRCNLKTRTFQATAEYPNAPRHKYNHVQGVLERTSDGQWVGKVTHSESAH